MNCAGAVLLVGLVAASGCSRGEPGGDPDAAGTGSDGAVADGATPDGSGGDGDGDGDGDGGGGTDGGGGQPDGGSTGPDAAPDAMGGIITGGPCMSGAAGATAFRIRWADGGGIAYVVYEVNGLPDPTDHAGAYGYTIGFEPQYVDKYLAQGGLLLDSSDFVDIELSTAGVGQIQSATLSIYGRSFNTTTSGSFNWQTFSGTGSSPYNLVSNVPPYAWYSADMTTEIDPGDDGVLIRIEAGPASNSLVVNRIEICMEAS